ncbi:hypothetical protein AURDEDRAFT_164166 [Auricularia subglabra TFB-10046 SS5]|nr:hypothetical protein AURDEDRAFT_164166 [Auricularia subglabra TFB-10046 SS5]
MAIILAVVQVLLQLRVYVMYDNSRALLWINAILFVVELSMFIYLSLHFAPRIAHGGDEPDDRCRACSVFTRSHALTYLTPLLYESYLVYLAVRKGWTHREHARQLSGNSTLSLLVRSSAQYFVLVASGMAVPLVLFLVEPRLVLWTDMLLDATASLGGTRLILLVRKAFLDQGLLSQMATAQMDIDSSAESPDDIPLRSNDSSTTATPARIIFYYGEPAGGAIIRGLTARGRGSNEIVCDRKNAPGPSACAARLDYLRENSGCMLATSPRSVCQTIPESGSRCCVSWHNPAPGLTEGDLVPAANAVLNECVLRTGMLGLTRNADLRGVCTKQCLSKRPMDC